MSDRFVVSDKDGDRFSLIKNQPGSTGSEGQELLLRAEGGHVGPEVYVVLKMHDVERLHAYLTNHLEIKYGQFEIAPASTPSRIEAIKTARQILGSDNLIEDYVKLAEYLLNGDKG